MREFKLYIGLTEDGMTEVLHASLKDDATPETFNIRSTNHLGIVTPSRFVKIEPLSYRAYGQHFHTSIWYVALSGIKDEQYVERVYKEYEEYQERVVLRHILKHLRRRRFLQPFQSIVSRSGLQLEHPLVTSLHTALVLQGDFTVAESLLTSLASASLFGDSLLASQPYAAWTRILGVDADGDTPSARGGHSMCIDTQNGVIYLFGGWDGQKNLDDFWVYDIKKDDWNLKYFATARERNGPGPRSCHKMVFDNSTGSIYLLGKLDDAECALSTRTNTPEVSSPRPNGGTPVPITPASVRASAHIAEFYRYHTRGLDAEKWDLVTPDTTAVGGPPLVFDHQMIIDSEAQMVYVSGGRVIDGDLDSIKYSGLYSYDIRANKWRMFHSSDPSTHPSIPSRYGHSMVLDPKSQTLFIFGGQRDEQYLSDMYAFHIPTNTVTELFSNFTVAGGPDACFTQRAVIDPDLREIYV
ncbi:hypothetical protein NM688_g8040 [Phlebia brevispora]|uniref:Uncharacterized protein n=1 Tax=Phlebia brevispora TaxID=194682 RepID=A0ACC1RY36_9APHY|nr:hypothetical protein NM688_g8040 [Phlebia brevispora]